jgi:hypothetical protein
MKNVHINMCPILDGYGVMTAFSFPYTPSCEPRLSSGGSLFLTGYRQSVLVISTLEWYLSRGGLVCPATASVAATGVQFVSGLPCHPFRRLGLCHSSEVPTVTPDVQMGLSCSKHGQ